MAKLTYLELTNRVLRRLTRADITDVTAATGQALIVTDAINEAQKALFSESINWYSLYNLRTFTTARLAASITISFADTDPDTILDSANAFVTSGFIAGMEVMVSGSTSNDGVYALATVAAGTLTLQSADALTVEAAGESITITAFTHPVASNFGRCIDLTNIPDNLVLYESYGREMDEYDPNMDDTSSPTDFIVQDDNYRFFPIPAAATKIRDRYWAIPTALAANGDTSDLPVECENCLIQWAWGETLRYLNSFDKADRVELKFNKMLTLARISNDKRLNSMRVMGGDFLNSTLRAPRFPSAYGHHRGFY